MRSRSWNTFKFFLPPAPCSNPYCRFLDGQEILERKGDANRRDLYLGEGFRGRSAYSMPFCFRPVQVLRFIFLCLFLSKFLWNLWSSVPCARCGVEGSYVKGCRDTLILVNVRLAPGSNHGLRLDNLTMVISDDWVTFNLFATLV